MKYLIITIAVLETNWWDNITKNIYVVVIVIFSHCNVVRHRDVIQRQKLQPTATITGQYYYIKIILLYLILKCLLAIGRSCIIANSYNFVHQYNKKKHLKTPSQSQKNCFKIMNTLFCVFALLLFIKYFHYLLLQPSSLFSKVKWSCNLPVHIKISTNTWQNYS